MQMRYSDEKAVRLKADILNITYDCYTQNNNVKMATINLIIGDDFFCSLLL